jgi:nicotinamide riboside transporter PnuC
VIAYFGYVNALPTTAQKLSIPATHRWRAILVFVRTVTTIIFSIAFARGRDAPFVGTFKESILALHVSAVLFVRTIVAIIISIAAPRVMNAVSIGTPEFFLVAGGKGHIAP